MYTRIKICGITRVEDALLAASLGADALGLVFFARSPRHVTISQAAEIVHALPPFVTTTGLFVNAAEAEIRAVLAALPLDLLQFHGDEREGDCVKYGRPYLKAIRMQDGTDLQSVQYDYPAARALLLDAYRPGVAGGTGDTFDWAQVPSGLKRPIILAGGLGPDNVAAAIHTVRPYAVDVSSGVEAAPGIKDPQRLRAFIEQVRGCS
ncbi:MAG: phosphoribosylanthranilate isomerase [Gammaproteobacteria bacterium]|nr:phosphoribosylanthranilate isomerase [Gammaproteobacteria bacterium]